MKKIKVYTKHCVRCDQPELWSKFETWCQGNGREYDVYRTAYWPKWHKKATKLWGEENYPVFIVVDKEIISLAKFMDEVEDKQIASGKEKDGVLPQAERPQRKARRKARQNLRDAGDKNTIKKEGQ